MENVNGVVGLVTALAGTASILLDTYGQFRIPTVGYGISLPVGIHFIAVAYSGSPILNPAMSKYVRIVVNTTIIDNLPPVLVCPSSVVVNATNPLGVSLTLEQLGITSTDNIDPSPSIDLSIQFLGLHNDVSASPLIAYPGPVYQFFPWPIICCGEFRRRVRQHWVL